jgi:hypothetical protein
MVNILCFFRSQESFAQIEMKITGSYSQDFNTLAPSGNANPWVDNQTLPGWYWQCGASGAPTTYYSDDGTSANYGKRCYGTTGDSDRAMGGLCSTIYKPYTYGVKLYNSSSQTITNMSIAYTGEQWRISADKSQQSIKFYYKITSSPEIIFYSTPNTANGWTEVPVLDFISPKDGHSTQGNINGNDPANRVVFSEYPIQGIVIPSGSYIFFRWNDLSDNSGDHGLAIDDITIKWTVPGATPSNVWNGSQSTDWFDSRNWSASTVPGVDADVEIAAVARGAVCNNDISIKSLKIDNGGSLTIDSSKTITVSGNSIFEGPNCMVLKSPLKLLNTSGDHAAAASFLCNGTVSGQGSVKVERYISEYLMDTDGWHLFSSPVNNPPIDSQFLPDVYDDLYTYYEIGDSWLSQKNAENQITNFVNGLGYLLSYNNSLVRNISGLPNNSNIQFNNLSFTGNRGWHLLGNPFPCGIRWGMTDWGINGINAIAKLLNSGGTYSDLSVGDIIPAMNGFFVKANSLSNTLTIPSSARLHSISEGWKQAKATIDKKIKMTISSNSDNTFAEAKINLNENATTGYDLNYDSPYLAGMYGTPLFYSVLSNGQKLSTNSVPEAAALVFNLEFIPGLAKEYTFKTEISDEWLKSSSFQLEDNKTKLKYSLVNGSSFTFNADTTDALNRFSLIVDIQTGLNNKMSEDRLLITSQDRHFIISLPNQYTTGKISVYELSGRQILSMNFTKGKIDFNLPNGGFYLVQLFFNNESVTRKIFAP